LFPLSKANTSLPQHIRDSQIAFSFEVFLEFIMSNRTHKLLNFVAITTIATASFIGTAQAQNRNYSYQVQGYPSTGAGSTTQPSRQYQQQQAEAQQRANTYYYQPMPANRWTPPQQQTQYTPYPDSSLRGIGFAPVPTQLSPRAIDGAYNFATKSVPNCVKGAVYGGAAGFYSGGPNGAVRGASAGCVENVITN
jgi:hypothetical protein